MAEERIVIEIDDSKAVAAAKRGNEAAKQLETSVQSIAKSVQDAANVQEASARKAVSSLSMLEEKYKSLVREMNTLTSSGGGAALTSYFSRLSQTANTYLENYKKSAGIIGAENSGEQFKTALETIGKYRSEVAKLTEDYQKLGAGARGATAQEEVNKRTLDSTRLMVSKLKEAHATMGDLDKKASQLGGGDRAVSQKYSATLQAVSAGIREYRALEKDTNATDAQRAKSLNTTTALLDNFNAGLAETKKGLDDLSRQQDGFQVIKTGLQSWVLELGKVYVGYQSFKKLLTEVRDMALEASRTEGLGVAVQTAGAVNGIRGSLLSRQEEELVNLNFTRSNARQLMLRMIPTGMDMGQTASLARAAQNLSVITNQSQEEAFNRIITAVQFGYPRAFRSMGMNLDVNEILRKYATEQGRKVTELEPEERIKALTPAVLQESQKLAGIYDKATLVDVNRQLNDISNKWAEISDKVGKEFNPALKAGVSILESMQNAIGKLVNSAPTAAAVGLTGLVAGVGLGAAKLGVGAAGAMGLAGAGLTGLGAAAGALLVPVAIATLTVMATAVTVQTAKGYAGNKVTDDLMKSGKTAEQLQAELDEKERTDFSKRKGPAALSIEAERQGYLAAIQQRRDLTPPAPTPPPDNKMVWEQFYPKLAAANPVLAAQRNLERAQEAVNSMLSDVKVVSKTEVNKAVQDARSAEINLGRAQAADKYRQSFEQRQSAFGLNGEATYFSEEDARKAKVEQSLIQERAQARVGMLPYSNLSRSEQAEERQRTAKEAATATALSQVGKRNMQDILTDMQQSLRKASDEFTQETAKILADRREAIRSVVTGRIQQNSRLEEARVSAAGGRDEIQQAEEVARIRTKAAADVLNTATTAVQKEQESLNYFKQKAAIDADLAIARLRVEEKIRKMREDTILNEQERVSKLAQSSITNRLGPRDEFQDIEAQFQERARIESFRIRFSRDNGRITGQEADIQMREKALDREADKQLAYDEANKRRFDQETQRRLTYARQEYDLADKRMRLAVGPGSEGEAIERSYQMRLDLAEQEYDISVKRGDTTKAQLEYEQQVRQAMVDKVSQQLDLYKQHFNEIKQSMGGLFDAAFTGQGNFGQAMGNMMRNMFLTPIKEGLTSMLARPMTDLMWGRDGRSGILGNMMRVFNPAGSEGGLKDVKSSSGAMHVRVVAVDPGAVGASAPGGGGLFSGGPGFIPTVLNSVGRGSASGGASRAGLIPTILGTLTGNPARYPMDERPPQMGGASRVPGGFIPTLLNSVGLGGMASASTAMASAGGFGGVFSSGGGSSPLAAAVQSISQISQMSGLLKLGSKLGSSLAGMGGRGLSVEASRAALMNNTYNAIAPAAAKNSIFSGLMGSVFNQGAFSSASSALGGGFLGNLGGGLAGVASSGIGGSLMLMGGMSLLGSGLAGRDRGTGKGILKGIGGGALTGAAIGGQFGGPLGALIGAGIGAAVGGITGLVQKLMGVESPQNKAKRLAKEIYGIGIDNRVADTIAAMAKQNFGGDVGVAMRSQEVRDLLQLWSDSTGQKSMLYLTKPMSASLENRGGSLGQALNYRNGEAYTFESGLLPTTPGGGSIIPSGNPYYGGSGPTITLNVNGSAAADFMEGRATKAVLGGSSRTSSATTLLDPSVAPF